MPLIIIASQDWNALVASVAALTSKVNQVIASQTKILANQSTQSQLENRIMTGQDDLKAQLATLATNVSDSTTAIEAGIAALIAANQNGDDAAFEAAAQALQTANATIRAETDKLNAALAPPPPPPPGP